MPEHHLLQQFPDDRLGSPTLGRIFGCCPEPSFLGSFFAKKETKEDIDVIHNKIIK